MTDPAAGGFKLDGEIDASGAFKRQPSVFRNWVCADGSSEYPVDSGRYHLYVAPACPWSHRTIIARRLMGLGAAITESWLNPYRDARGWAFTGGQFIDPHYGWDFLSSAYEATDSGFDGRVSVPVLWDKQTRKIVSNESSDITRMLATEFAKLAEHPVDLYPAALEHDMQAICDRLYDGLNNAVYRVGFATKQDAYDRAFWTVFETLDWLEERLSKRRYLLGDEPTAADWRAFPTLVRFDVVYFNLFKVNLHRLTEYPNVWAYTRDLFQVPSVAGTVEMAQIKRHYFTTHDMLNPGRIIPLGPVVNFREPHEREQLSARRADLA